MKPWKILLVAAVILVPFVLGTFFPAKLTLGWLWLLFALATLVAFGAIGSLITNASYGILIDSRNKLSLSRFQVVICSKYR